MCKIDPNSFVWLLLLAPCVLRLAPPALAEPFNLEPPPLGDRSAGMGNVGVASTDATSLYFNPAGLAGLPAGTWLSTVAGYAEAGSAAQEQSFLDQDVRVATMDGMLSFAGTARSFPWGGAGLAFVAPERRTEEALKKFGPLRTTLAGEEFSFPKGNLFVDARTTTMEIGPAVAISLPGLKASIGVHALYSARRSQIARAYSLTTESGDFLALETSYEQLSQAARLGGGAHWKVLTSVSVGASYSMSIPLSDTISVSKLLANIDQDEIRELLTQLLAGQITQEEAVARVFSEGFVTTHGEFKRPSVLRVGAEAQLPMEIVGAFEGVYFFPTDQNLGDLPAPFNRARQEGVLNLHVGAEKELAARFKVRAGFYTDGTTHPSLSGLSRSEIEETGFDRRTPRDADLYHVTGGAAFGDARASVSVSANYGLGSGKIVNVLGNVRDEFRQDLILGLGATVGF